MVKHALKFCKFTSQQSSARVKAVQCTWSGYTAIFKRSRAYLESKFFEKKLLHEFPVTLSK